MIHIILLAILVGNVGSVLIAALLLRLDIQVLLKWLKHVNAFAGGTLLGAAFLGMLPNAIKLGGAEVSYVVLGGIVFFFLVEKMLLWRICVDENCDRHSQAGANMLMIGDSFHNFLDGVVIAAAFIHSTSFGLIVAFSVFAHEIPQEIADFGVMIKSGFSKKKAILYNLLSGLTALLGGLLAWYFGLFIQGVLPYVLAFSAAGFMYISLADLIPELHKKGSLKESVFQILFLLLGISFIILAITFKP
ncbi:MAG: ZIP family metal transporter [Paludibacteraceae bacterium]|nr:ZIP family metal transporter [Paludibacteraceae bacterium]MBP6284195.1 ZIP family metal transporter [Paludibacteraceae bacterium]